MRRAPSQRCNSAVVLPALWSASNSAAYQSRRDTARRRRRPSARLFPQGGGLCGRVESVAVAGVGQGFGHPAGCGSGNPAVAEVEERCMGSSIQDAERKRNYLMFIKCLGD